MIRTLLGARENHPAPKVELKVDLKKVRLNLYVDGDYKGYIKFTKERKKT